MKSSIREQRAIMARLYVHSCRTNELVGAGRTREDASRVAMDEIKAGFHDSSVKAEIKRITDRHLAARRFNRRIASRATA